MHLKKFNIVFDRKTERRKIIAQTRSVREKKTIMAGTQKKQGP